MARNVPPAEIYQFISGDFEDAWNSLAANIAANNRGNFMFARQAMGLLEWAARLCAGDTTGVAVSDLSNALMQREPKYFTQLPGVCADFDEFDLPCAPGIQPQRQLLWTLFDLARNGQAHQYQQIVLDLTDGRDLMISHSGAQFGMSLQYVRS